MKIPAKISPCPIVEASVGILFEPNIINDAVFGIIFKAFQSEYPNVASLPVSKIPEEIRHKDPKLINQPHYKISNERYSLLIGPRVITISCRKEYIGWNLFSKEIDKALNKIREAGVIKEVQRLGVRYINLFDINIFENIRLVVKVGDEPLESKNTFVRAEIPSNDFLSVLQIANNATMVFDNETFTGSVIDIDTSTTNNLNDFFSSYHNLVMKGHEEEKKIFFELLNPAFLATLNPTYDGVL
jgi:uncharacterized protein (TIGR04255 family)